MKPARRAGLLFCSCNPTPLFAAAPPPASTPVQGARGGLRGTAPLLANHQALTFQGDRQEQSSAFLTASQSMEINRNSARKSTSKWIKKTKNFTIWGSLLKSTLSGTLAFSLRFFLHTCIKLKTISDTIGLLNIICSLEKRKKIKLDNDLHLGKIESISGR